MAGQKQKETVSIGRIKIIFKTKELTYKQRVQIADLMDELLKAVIADIRHKKGEPPRKFDIRMGSTIRRFRGVANELMRSSIPIQKDDVMKYAGECADKISAILKDAGIAKKTRNAIRLEVEGELLNVFFDIKPQEKKTLPIHIKKTGPVSI